MCSMSRQSPCRSPRHTNPSSAGPVLLPDSPACTSHRSCWLDPAVPSRAAMSHCQPSGCHCPPSFRLAGKAAPQTNHSTNSGCHLRSSRHRLWPKPASGSVLDTLPGIPLCWGAEALFPHQSSLLPRRHIPNPLCVKGHKNAWQSGVEEWHSFHERAGIVLWNPDAPPGG